MIRCRLVRRIPHANPAAALTNQSMDRKGIIAITLAIVTLFAWTFYSQREAQKTAVARAEQVRAAEAAKNTEAPATSAPGAQPATPGGAVPPVPATVGGEPAVAEKIETLPTPSFRRNSSRSSKSSKLRFVFRN